MGSRCSSRVESSHSAMKRYVNLAKCDLLTCKERLDVLLETQFTELQAEIETDKLKVVHSYRIPIFRGLQNKISSFALSKLHFQYVQSETRTECLGLFSRTFGLPCKHVINQYKREEKPLGLDLIHSQWILNEAGNSNPSTSGNVNCPSTATQNYSSNHSFPVDHSLLEVFEALQENFDQASSSQQAVLRSDLERISTIPIIEPREPDLDLVRKRGRPAGSKNNANKRIRSHFEHVDAEVNGNRCGTCGNRGHNSRKCPNRVIGPAGDN
jgi:hypothetical protein